MLPFLPLENEIGNIPVSVVLNVLLGLPWMGGWENGELFNHIDFQFYNMKRVMGKDGVDSSTTM